MLTIGGLASYAGVTVRAIRHYHAKGLLPEPERDRSGYRRYDAAAVVELIRIRTLAEAGVPLSRVRELLQADEATFAAAVAEIDERLREEIAVRRRHRERIAGLVSGDGLALPPEVARLLDRLRALGVDERIAQLERDGWIVLAAHRPDRVRAWARRKHEQLADRPLQDFYSALGEALDRADDDPELDDLADRMAASIAQTTDRPDGSHHDEADLEAPLAELMDTLAFDSAPPARRLAALLRARGWTGWTRFDRTGPERDADPPQAAPSRSLDGVDA